MLSGASLVPVVGWRLSALLLTRRFPWLTGRRTRLLVVGTGAQAEAVRGRLAGQRGLPVEVVGFLSVDGCASDVGPVLGAISALREAVNAHRVERVVLACPALSRDESLALASQCGAMGLEVYQVPFSFGQVSARVEGVRLGDLSLVRLGGLGYTSAALGVKRVFDVVAVLLGGLCLLPLLLLVAALIKLHDGGPVLYVSRRSGQGGRSFDFFKFRSMVPGAAELRPDEQNEADGRLFKVRDDPRVTPIGHFIRRWSLDELPQLLNVLRGDMNLVGPRPLPMGDLQGIEQDPEHRYWFEQRSRVKPGITGLWQVHGRSELPFKAMVDLDVRYIQDWSLLMDLQILIRTVPAVLRGRGAH
ncbi:MAG: exopolysaccharide biosynthesis polyprenyl glycosylphosphotransferase [Deltaproteobacteria bacterium]|nr:exopolysaccharide biosynthesis polyprenyl glycosylphosphotransferase [Deltaproteobacteria bacterium]